jgi:hypothetical protein
MSDPERRRHEQLIQTLAWYVHEDHPYSWDEASFHKDATIKDGQERHRIVVEDQSAFWHIHYRLKRERRW